MGLGKPNIQRHQSGNVARELKQAISARTLLLDYSTMFQQSFSAGGAHNPMKDWEVQQPPDDSISKIVFSPQANYLVAGSWDNNVSNMSRVHDF